MTPGPARTGRPGFRIEIIANDVRFLDRPPGAAPGAAPEAKDEGEGEVEDLPW